MAHKTPGLEDQQARLAALSSRYVDPESIPWVASPFPGVENKVLMQDPETGMQTVLTRMAPGAVLNDHMHVEIEQTWVLEGSLVDHEGEAKVGSFVFRPPGSRHTASAPNGALLLGIFQKPNKFF
jgi:anti-sigma factor ChrR (cupin superfamily)